MAESPDKGTVQEPEDSEPREITEEELKSILEAHRLWCNTREKGLFADVCG